MCRKKRGRSKGDTWWWNEEVKEEVSRSMMCQNSTEENKRRCKSKKYKAKKTLSKTMQEKAE